MTSFSNCPTQADERWAVWKITQRFFYRLAVRFMVGAARPAAAARTARTASGFMFGLFIVFGLFGLFVWFGVSLVGCGFLFAARTAVAASRTRLTAIFGFGFCLAVLVGGASFVLFARTARTAIAASRSC